MSWNGVKKQSLKSDIEAWCEEMRIENYTINSKGEIDVNGSVWLNKKNFKELPYKFGKVGSYFSLSENKKLTSLKNCPNYVGDSFGCRNCSQLDSLVGCPKQVMNDFYCFDCKRLFTEKDVKSLCKVKKDIII